MPMSIAIFLAAGAVSFFAFLSVTYWANARSGERRTQERYALLRHVAERPGEAARLVIELLREEDARLDEKARQKAIKARQDSILGGWILIGVGVGMAVMVGSVADEPYVWTVGLMPMLIGVAMIGYEVVSGRGQNRQTASRS